MKKTLKISLVVALASLTALGVVAASREQGTAERARAPATVPVRTSPVRGLVLARPFALAEPYEHVWRLEKPSVRSGWLLVLEVDPSFVQPKQVLTPVLLVGDQTVECVNFGQETGRVVAIVPAPADENGVPELDLAASPAWFASPELPERVDAAWISAERARALPAEVATFTAAEITTARERAGATLRLANRIELDQQAALLILEHSPSDHEIAEALLVPVRK